MTLALLLTAVTGAWAITDPNAVYWDSQTWSEWKENVTTHTVGDITITATGSGKVYQSTSSGEPLAMEAGANDAITFTSNGKSFASIAIITGDELNVAGWTYNSSTWSYEWSGEPTTSVTLSGCDIKADAITFTFGTAEAPITVEPVTGQQNQWTFSMPGSDVVLTPIYAKAAAFATTGTEPEVTTLLPAAAEGVIAGTDAPLIAEGTGIVAFAGTSTEVTQGTVMYAVTPATVTDATELIPSDWKNTVPTAKNIADGGAEVKVWYYIQGADTPDGETPTADNTFNDSEICTTPLTVTVRSNKFDLAFKAANANTIDATQASKGTVSVKVGDAAAVDKTEDIADGKLKAIKMGSEVKLNAKQGYKFRKVEVKKASTPTLNITSPEVGQVIGSDGKNYAYGSLPTGVTPVAKICYVSGSNGLALALTDDGYMDWSTAMTTCAAHTPAFSNGTWKLASKDEWENMISAAGSYTALRNGFSSVGGTNLKTNYLYWSSTEDEEESVSAWGCNFSSGGGWADDKGNYYYFRACLEW